MDICLQPGQGLKTKVVALRVLKVCSAHGKVPVRGHARTGHVYYADAAKSIPYKRAIVRANMPGRRSQQEHRGQQNEAPHFGIFGSPWPHLQLALDGPPPLSLPFI